MSADLSDLTSPARTAYLRVLRGISGKPRWPVGQKTTVGREAPSDIQIPEDKGVSRQHFTIYAYDDAYRIENRSQTNETRVNHTAIQQSAELKHGDRISIGQSVLLRFEIDEPKKRSTRQSGERSPLRKFLPYFIGIYLALMVGIVFILQSQTQPPVSDTLLATAARQISKAEPEASPEIRETIRKAIYQEKLANLKAAEDLYWRAIDMRNEALQDLEGEDANSPDGDAVTAWCRRRIAVIREESSR